MPTTLVCFEDSSAANLHPITLSRPAYAITSAGYRLVDWLQQLSHSSGGKLLGRVRPHLKAIQELDFGIDAVPQSFADKSWDDCGDGVLLVNARLSPSVSIGETLGRWIKSEQSGAIREPESGCVWIARINGKDWKKLREEKLADQLADNQNAVDVLLEFAATRNADEFASQAKAIDVFDQPHDVIRCHMKEMTASMNHRLRQSHYTEILDGVFVGQKVKIGDHVVTNVDEGPILLEDHCNVGPLSYLSGPIHAGPNAKVIEHASIKDGVCLGHTTKTGGEVEACVIEPYTNKQHHGFLGHSYLGSWINLGAGTCNSDLKNTYGKINIQYGDQKVATGMQFLGCFIGDYSKTAINTSIFTGKTIGVCSMMYGFVTSNVPSYVNYAKVFGQTSVLPVDVMINTQQRMFARRQLQQRECDKQLIRDMYDLTQPERATDPELT